MTLRQFFCQHIDTYRERNSVGRLCLTCHRCQFSRPVGLQDRPYPVQAPTARPKAKRAPRVQRPAVVRFPKVVNK